MKQIWKRARLWPLVLAAIMSLGMTAAPAMAAGETYTWTDTTGFTTFTGNGPNIGDFTTPVTFTRSGTTTGIVTYT
ncbi:DUF4124 domain-containing protein, partial [Candidatus Saccharibacteria bacterium]|nr:DUF4124 domain-containing protein [Candidatus Saccharibacteria bacterium]